MLKKLLPFTLLFCIWQNANAQKLILGLNAGINGSVYEESRGFGGYGLVRFYTQPNFEHIQFAVGADVGYITNNVTINYNDINTGAPLVRKIKSSIANPYFLPHLTINYRTAGRSYLFAGATGGYMFSYVQVLSSGYNANNIFIVDRVGNKLCSGLSTGIQTGYVLNIKRNFALNAEIAARWASLDNAQSKINFWYFPISAGFRLKLYTDKEYDLKYKKKKQKRYYR